MSRAGAVVCHDLVAWSVSPGRGIREGRCATGGSRAKELMTQRGTVDIRKKKRRSC